MYGKLYSKLLLSLEGTAIQNIMSRANLQASGLMLLQDLVQTYEPKNVPDFFAAKTGEFWSNMKQLPNESVDTYYTHFHELLDDLKDADEPTSIKSSISYSFWVQNLLQSRIIIGLVTFLVNGKLKIGLHFVQRLF